MERSTPISGTANLPPVLRNLAYQRQQVDHFTQLQCSTLSSYHPALPTVHLVSITYTSSPILNCGSVLASYLHYPQTEAEGAKPPGNRSTNCNKYQEIDLMKKVMLVLLLVFVAA